MVLISAPQMFAGYATEMSTVAESSSAPFSTGDLGFLDVDGCTCDCFQPQLLAQSLLPTSAPCTIIASSLSSLHNLNSTAANHPPIKHHFTHTLRATMSLV